MKKVAFVLVLGFMLRVLAACCFIAGDCCECPEAPTFFYSIESLSSNHLDNSGQYAVVVWGGASVSKTAYGIQVESDLKLLSYHKNNATLFFNQAYAMDCDCYSGNKYVLNDSIVVLKIITLNDLNATHQANAEVTDFFKIWYGNQYITVQEFLKKKDIQYQYEYNFPERKNIQLFLINPAVDTGEHRFRVELVLASGSIVQSTTSVINLE